MFCIECQKIIAKYTHSTKSYQGSQDTSCLDFTTIHHILITYQLSVLGGPTHACLLSSIVWYVIMGQRNVIQRYTSCILVTHVYQWTLGPKQRDIDQNAKVFLQESRFIRVIINRYLCSLVVSLSRFHTEEAVFWIAAIYSVTTKFTFEYWWAQNVTDARNFYLQS